MNREHCLGSLKIGLRKACDAYFVLKMIKIEQTVYA